MKMETVSQTSPPTSRELLKEIKNMKKENLITKEKKCKKCGHCCILFPVVCLTPKEVFQNKYKVRKKPLDDDIILQREYKYIPELKRKVKVCVYFNPINNLCLLGKNRPRACRKMFCDGDNFLERWNVFKKN